MSFLVCDDIRYSVQEILNMMTYKAVRTVLHQLYEMNPPQYTWFYKWVRFNRVILHFFTWENYNIFLSERDCEICDLVRFLLFSLFWQLCCNARAQHRKGVSHGTFQGNILKQIIPKSSDHVDYVWSKKIFAPCIRSNVTRKLDISSWNC